MYAGAVTPANYHTPIGLCFDSWAQWNGSGGLGAVAFTHGWIPYGYRLIAIDCLYRRVILWAERGCLIHYGILTAMSGRVKCDSIVLAGSTEYAPLSHALTGWHGRWGRLKAGCSGPICLARVARNALVVTAWLAPNGTYSNIHSDCEHYLIPYMNRELLPSSTCKLGYVGAANFHYFPMSGEVPA